MYRVILQNTFSELQKGTNDKQIALLCMQNNKLCSAAFPGAGFKAEYQVVRDRAVI